MAAGQQIAAAVKDAVHNVHPLHQSSITFEVFSCYFMFQQSLVIGVLVLCFNNHWLLVC